MDDASRLQLARWLVAEALTGSPEAEIVRGFCERCCAHGFEIGRGLMLIDTLHPIFEGRAIRWSDIASDTPETFTYGSSEEGEAAQVWQQSVFYHMLEHGHEDLCVVLNDETARTYSRLDELVRDGLRHAIVFVHRFGDAGTIGQMDCVYSYWATRRVEGFPDGALETLRGLVPLLGLAIKCAAHAHIARTLGEVYLGRGPAEQVMRGRIARGVTERITAVLWFSDLRSSTAISEAIAPSEIIPFLNDYAGAAIGAIHDAGGDVLKLIGDGVLAVFTGDDIAVASRAALRAENLFRTRMADISARRAAAGQVVTTAHLGLHVGEVFYGNIGSEDRLDFTVVGPAVNEVSRIASMCRSIDREVLASSAFHAGLDAEGRGHLVSTGRYVLRGIDRAQDLYTLDPALASAEDAQAGYARYLAV